MGFQHDALDDRQQEFKKLATVYVQKQGQLGKCEFQLLLEMLEQPSSLQEVYLITISRVQDGTLPDGRVSPSVT